MDPSPARSHQSQAADPSVPVLPLTGERTLPGVPDERYWFQRHVVAYLRAGRLVRRLRARSVLDAGCGEGYGLAMLRTAGATRVVGVDLDPPTVARARARYARVDAGIEVVEADLSCLPIADGEVDLTVSFQVIEHLHDVPGYLRSLRRVTRPGGTIVLATPNRLTFTPDADTPVNPFHTREYAADELADVLHTAGLHVDAVEGVHHGDQVRTFEQHRGRPLVEDLLRAPAQEWDAELRGLVHRVEPGWFTLRCDDLDACLDLIATCRTPARAGR